MLPQFVLFLLFSLIAPATTQEFPAKVQVDLIFPKNETYAPTGYFPVVYAIRNFQVAEPLGLDLYGTIKTHRSRKSLIDDSIRGRDFDSWRIPDRYRYFGGVWGESRDADPMFLVTSITPITNGTDTHFYVGWTMGMANCTDLLRSEAPQIVDRNGNIPWETEEQLVEFSIAPDGKVPDIEEAIRSCDYQSFAINVEGTGHGSPEAECGDLRNVKPSDHCDLLSDYAEEVAANVSDRVLSRLGCEKGTWQDMMEDCPDLAVRYGQRSGWAALVAVLTGLLMV